MDKLIFLIDSSVDPALEAAESVPCAVQTASSGGLRVIECILVIISIILVLLMIILIAIELRQDTLRKMVHNIAERLELIERKILHSADEDTYSDSEEVTKRTVRTPGTSRTISEDNVQVSLTVGPDPNCYSNRENSIITVNKEDFPIEEGSDCYELNNRHLAGTGKTAFVNNGTPDSEKPYILTGLSVKGSSHFSQNRRVKFDDVAISDAVFILYSDMTLVPDERLFKVYNRASYYYNHDFHMIYDFQDKEGYQINMRRQIKCIEVAKAATVTKSKNGYLLKERGILIAEER